MSIARVTEISSTSTTGFEDAIRQDIARAHKTLRGISGAWVKEQNVMINEGQIKEYRVNLLVTFLLDD